MRRQGAAVDGVGGGSSGGGGGDGVEERDGDAPWPKDLSLPELAAPRAEVLARG